tara:strand:- start:789 stop:995 length:207 start_codon:yes stop_codon:yes gene_type:complete
MRNSYKGYWFYIESNVERKCWELILEKKSKLELNGMHFVQLKNTMTLGEIYELALDEIDKKVEEEMKR